MWRDVFCFGSHFTFHISHRHPLLTPTPLFCPSPGFCPSLCLTVEILARYSKSSLFRSPCCTCSKFHAEDGCAILSLGRANSYIEVPMLMHEHRVLQIVEYYEARAKKTGVRRKRWCHALASAAEAEQQRSADHSDC
jgi:hypothetical protein